MEKSFNHFQVYGRVIGAAKLKYIKVWVYELRNTLKSK